MRITGEAGGIDPDSTAGLNSGLLGKHRMGPQAHGRKHGFGLDLAVVVKHGPKSGGGLIDRDHLAAEMPINPHCGQGISHHLTHAAGNQLR